MARHGGRRYLSGHAVLAPNGLTFFTSETNADTGQGLVVERDLQSLRKLREFPSGGIGPHALLLEPAGTLLVANGGILNLPETGRRKLNIAHMDPNLTRLDTDSGHALAQYRLPDHYLSLRHLALAPNDIVGVALQAEHPEAQARQTAPALALLEGDHLRAIPWDAAGAPAGWDGYGGDVCCAANRFWVSAPHAGWLTSWSQEGQDGSVQALPGAGALATQGARWLVGGSQTAWVYQASTHPQHYGIALPWDNHAVLV